MENEIKLKITIDGKEAQASIQLTEQELRNLVSSVRRAGEQSRDAGRITVDAFTAARNTIQGLKETFDIFRTAFISQIESYKNAEAALSKLVTAMQQSGYYTDSNLKDLLDYSSKLQEITIYGDDVTQTIMAQMLAMGLNIEQTKQATLQAANLATVMGTDLNSAARAMADLFQGNVGMIGRYIKGLDETIIKSGDLTKILDMLNERIGGQAEAIGNTTVGAIAKLNNRLDDLRENTGKIIANALNPLLTTLSSIFREINNLSPALSGIIGLVGSMTVAMTILKTTGLTSALMTLMTWTPTINTAAIATGGFTAAITSATIAVRSFFASLGPIGWVLTALGLIASAWIAIKSATDDATKSQTQYINSLQTKNRYELQRELDLNKKRQETIALLMIDPLLTEQNKKNLQNELDLLLKREALLKNELNKLRMLSYNPSATQLSTKGDSASIKQQEELYNELLLRSKKGREKELEQLRQKYEQEKTIAAGNQELLKMLEENYRKEILNINIKYDREEFERELNYWKQISKLREEERKKSRFADKVTEYPSEGLKYTPDFMSQTTEEIINQNLQMSLSYNTLMAFNEGLKEATIQTAQFGAKSISVWLSNAIGIQRANSLLQMFIASLIEAFTQALLLKFAMVLINPIGGVAASATPAATGAVVTKPNLMLVGEGKEPEGVFPLSYLNNLLFKQPQIRTINDVNIKLEPVEFKQSGMDLRAVLNAVNKHIRTKR